MEKSEGRARDMAQNKEESRIGLVLSGGGAKGAYQAGVFQAMAELGLCHRVKAISGCSIGAMNALLFAAGDPERWRRMWEESDFSGITGGGISPARMEALAGQAAKAGGLENYLRGEWVLPLEGLERLIREVADPEKLAKGKPKISVCAYQLEAEEPRYFWLDGRPYEEAVKLAAASGAIPVAFPPVEVGGKHYCDGGMTPPYCGKKNGDKIPLAPLTDPELGLDVILVVYLTPYDQVKKESVPAGTRLVELRPSQPLEPSPSAGTLDFSRESIRWRRRLGIEDGRKLLGGAGAAATPYPAASQP